MKNLQIPVLEDIDLISPLFRELFWMSGGTEMSSAAMTEGTGEKLDRQCEEANKQQAGDEFFYR